LSDDGHESCVSVGINIKLEAKVLVLTLEAGAARAVSGNNITNAINFMRHNPPEAAPV